MLRLRFCETDYAMVGDERDGWAEGDCEHAYIHEETYSSVSAFVSALEEYAANGEPSSCPGKLSRHDWLSVRDEDVFNPDEWTERTVHLMSDCTPMELMLFNGAYRKFSHYARARR